MGSYITTGEALQAISRVDSVYRNEAGNIVNSLVEQEIADAEAILNAAIDDRYAVPVTSSSGVAYLKGLVKSILRFKTYLQFSESMEMPQNVSTDYTETMRIVRELGRKQMSIPGTDEKTTGRPSYLVTNLDTPKLSSDDLEYY